MEENTKDSRPSSHGNDPKEFVDEKTKNKVDRHLHDIDDTISDEDIKNADTDISSDRISGNENKNVNETADEPSRNKKQNDDTPGDRDELPSPWGILE